MSKDQLFLGIDSGTQGTKAIVFSREQGKIIAEAYADHRIIETNEGISEISKPTSIAELNHLSTIDIARAQCWYRIAIRQTIDASAPLLSQ